MVSLEQKRVDFFKDIADEDEETADIAKLAKKNQIANPDQVLTELAGITGADYQNNKPSFPTQTLKYYNQGLSEQGDLLTSDDISALQWIIDRYANKLMKQHEPKPSYSRLSDTFSQVPSSAAMPQSIALPPEDPEAEPEAQLFEYVLTSIYNPRPHLVSRFLDYFKRFHHFFERNPDQLFAVLVRNFGNDAGQLAYGQWARLKSDIIPPSMFNPSQGMQQGMPNVINPMAMGQPANPMQGNPFMPQAQPKTAEEIEDERRWARMERMADRNMRLQYMQMMGNMSGNNGNQQIAPPPPGTAYIQEPVFDAHGRATGLYRNIPTPIQGSGDNEILKTLLATMTQQNTALLQNYQSPNAFLEKVAVQALTTHQTNADPFASFSKMLEVANSLNQNKQVDTKPLEIISKEIDAKLALKQIENAEKKEEREFQRELEGEKTANSNTQMYIDSIKEVITKGITPFMGQVMQGQLQQQQPQMQMAQQTQQSQAQQQINEAEMAARQAEVIRMQQQQQAMERARVLQQEQKLKEAQQAASQRPVEEVIAERSDGQLEQDFSELDAQLRHLQGIYQRVAAEKAKRRMIRSGGIATRADQQQQQVFAERDTSYGQSFEERIAAGERAVEENNEVQAAAGHYQEDPTKATTAAVVTQMNQDDLEALRASPDGGNVEPMSFGISGPPREAQEAKEAVLDEEEEGEQEEEYEGDEEPEGPTSEPEEKPKRSRKK